MIEIPVVRWGKPYESMEQAEVVHFETGETLAKVHQANGGIVKMDMRKASRARDILRQHRIADLISMCEQAADIFENDTLPLGNGTQSPDDFCKLQSATTGLPENMCRFNIGKTELLAPSLPATLIEMVPSTSPSARSWSIVEECIRR